MDSNQVNNITDNIMLQYNIDKCFKWQIETLVPRHWPRRVQIYRYLCNIAPGSRVVDENEQYYVVQWEDEIATELMDNVSKEMFVQRLRILENYITQNKMFEVKVWK